MKEVLIINENRSDNLGDLAISEAASKIFKAHSLNVKTQRICY